eukprot:scaffold41238_cov19-Prasinocladus_malaysianus.AAC.1
MSRLRNGGVEKAARIVHINMTVDIGALFLLGHQPSGQLAAKFLRSMAGLSGFRSLILLTSQLALRRGNKANRKHIKFSDHHQ